MHRMAEKAQQPFTPSQKFHVSKESILTSIDVLKFLDRQLCTPPLESNPDLTNICEYPPYYAHPPSNASNNHYMPKMPLNDNCSEMEVPMNISRASLKIASPISPQARELLRYDSRTAQPTAAELRPLSHKTGSSCSLFESCTPNQKTRLKLKLPIDAFVQIETPQGPQFRCAYAGCNKTYSICGSNAKAHWMVHQRIMPYSCKFCQKPFTRKHDCERHETVHERTK